MASIRQEINILNAILTAASGSSATSNEIVLLNTDNFSQATFYFEIVANSSATLAFSVTLVGATDGTVSTISVPLGTTTYTLFRSTSFSPTTKSQDFTVQISNTAGATKNVKSARIVVVQSDITYSETQIEIGSAFNTTSLTNVAPGGPKYWKYVAADWNTGVTAYFEAVFQTGTSKSAATVTLQVADGTGDGFVNWADVSGAALTTTSTTPARVRSSSSITLTAGRNYRIVGKAGNTKSGLTVYSAKIILIVGGLEVYGSQLSSVPGQDATALSSTTIAVVFSSFSAIKAYRFDGTNWTQVGNTNTVSAMGWPSITALSSSRIAYVDDNNDLLRTYDFDGTNWSQAGNSFSVAVTKPRITALSSTRIAMVDSGTATLRTYDFDGTNWSLVGNAFSLSSVSGATFALTALSSSRIAYVDDNNDILRTYDFDGTNWSQAGNSFSAATAAGPALVALSASLVVLGGGGTIGFKTLNFDGTNWTQVGCTTPPTGGSMYYVGLAKLTSNTVAQCDTSDQKLTTYYVLSQYEGQYLLANSTLSSGTGLQLALTQWASEEFVSVTTVFKSAFDAANGSTSVAELDTAADTQITNSSVSSPDNQGISSGNLTMPGNGNLDCKATTNNNDLYSAKLLVRVTPPTVVTVYPGSWHPEIARPVFDRKGTVAY